MVGRTPVPEQGGRLTKGLANYPTHTEDKVALDEEGYLLSQTARDIQIHRTKRPCILVR